MSIHHHDYHLDYSQLDPQKISNWPFYATGGTPHLTGSKEFNGLVLGTNKYDYVTALANDPTDGYAVMKGISRSDGKPDHSF